MRKAEDDFEELLANMQDIDDDSEVEEAIMLILEKIQHLDKQGKLFCTCGNKELFVDILDSDVILMCGDCGQSMTFPRKANSLNSFKSFLICLYSPIKFHLSIKLDKFL